MSGVRINDVCEKNARRETWKMTEIHDLSSQNEKCDVNMKSKQEIYESMDGVLTSTPEIMHGPYTSASLQQGNEPYTSVGNKLTSYTSASLQQGTSLTVLLVAHCSKGMSLTTLPRLHGVQVETYTFHKQCFVAPSEWG